MLENEIKIPGVEIVIKSLPEGQLPFYYISDNYGNVVDRMVATEFNVACAVREDKQVALKEAYKTLAVQVLKKYLEDTSTDTIIISIRSPTWDKAFAFTGIEENDVVNPGVKGLLHGVFSVTPLNSKEKTLKAER